MLGTCHIGIVFAEPERRFVAGEEVRVSVTVTADRPVKCDALLFEVRWFTHGSGSTNEGTPIKKTLFEGQFEEGAQTFEVTFAAPNGPLTYSGELINLDWEVKVRVDIPRGLDTTSQRGFVLHGPVGDDYNSGPVGVERRSRRRLPPLPRGANFVGIRKLILGLLAALGVAAWFFVEPVVYEEVELSLAVFVLMLLFFVGVFVVYVAHSAGIHAVLRRHLNVSRGERALGPVTIDVGDPYRAGDVVPVTVSFMPRRAVQLDTVRVMFFHSEWVRVRNLRLRSRNQIHVISREVFPVAYEAYAAGEPVEVFAEFAVPRDAAATLSLSNNKIRWQVLVHVGGVIERAGSLDWTHEVDVLILPPMEDDTHTVLSTSGALPSAPASPQRDVAVRASAAAPAPEARTQAPVSTPADDPKPAFAGPERIIELVQELPTFGFLSNEQEARVLALQQDTFRLQFEVHEADQTSTADRRELAGGQTVLGRLSDGVEIRVQLSPGYDESVVEVGKTVVVIASVVRWDAGARTMVLREITE